MVFTRLVDQGILVGQAPNVRAHLGILADASGGTGRVEQNRCCRGSWSDIMRNLRHSR